MLSSLFLEKLKDANDIEEVIGSYVNLKRRGKTLVGLCPFHSEKTPSFTVFPDGQSFYCFGCAVGGDVITFIKKVENLEYLEAVRFLAKRAGMEMPQDNADDSRERLKTRILEANRAAARHYFQNLTSQKGQAGRAYLQKRGLSPAIIKRFGLGLALDSWDDLARALRQQGFREEELYAANLVSRGRNGSVFDRFRNRVMFPIIDMRGNVVAFGGRDLGDKGPKYLNSSDTPVFQKSRNLFALNFAKSSGKDQLILAEGYMDVIAIHAAGFTNAVATLGTSLTQEQARLMAHYAQEVIIAYDADGAGQTATKRAIGIFSSVGLPSRVLHVEDAKDPDEYIHRFGAARFQILLEKCRTSTEYELQKAAQKYDLGSDEGRVQYLNEAAKYLSSVGNPIERDIYISRLAGQTGVAKSVLSDTVAGMIKRRAAAQKRKEQKNLKVEYFSGRDKVNPEGGKHPKAAFCEERILGILFRHPDFYKKAASELGEEHFVTSFHRRVFLRLKELLEAGQPVELVHFSQLFSDEEMGRLAQLSREEAGVNDTYADFSHYVRALKEAGEEKTPEELGQMSPQELMHYLQRRKGKGDV